MMTPGRDGMTARELQIAHQNAIVEYELARQALKTARERLTATPEGASYERHRQTVIGARSEDWLRELERREIAMRNTPEFRAWRQAQDAEWAALRRHVDLQIAVKTVCVRTPSLIESLQGGQL